MNTIARKKSHIKSIHRGKYSPFMPFQEYEQRIERTTLLGRVYRQGIGLVLIFSDGYEHVIDPTRNYTACSRLIDKIFQEKTAKKRGIDKQNLLRHVA